MKKSIFIWIFLFNCFITFSLDLDTLTRYSWGPEIPGWGYHIQFYKDMTFKFGYVGESDINEKKGIWEQKEGKIYIKSTEIPQLVNEVFSIEIIASDPFTKYILNGKGWTFYCKGFEPDVGSIIKYNGDKIVVIPYVTGKVLVELFFIKHPSIQAEPQKVRYADPPGFIEKPFLDPGSKVRVIGRSEYQDKINGENYYWYFIVSDLGGWYGFSLQTGWVYGKYLEIKKT